MDMIWILYFYSSQWSKRRLGIPEQKHTHHWTLHKGSSIFRTFNIAWIFSWEYQFHNYLLNTFSLYVIRVYKFKWWNEYKIKSCGKENVEFFCRTKTKKFTLHNLHTFVKKEIATGSSTPFKRESPSSSTKTRSRGLKQKEREILELLKDYLAMRQVFLQKIRDKKGNDSGDETVVSVESSIKPKSYDLHDSQDPYDL